MAMLDHQFETPTGHEFCSVFYNQAIDVSGREVQDGSELIQFADTERLCASITETARRLSDKRLNMLPIFTGIETKGLEERLQELGTEIADAEFVGLEFPATMTQHSSGYDDLLTVFGEVDQIEGAHKVIIPGSRIKAVTTLSGQFSENAFEPRVILRVSTGLEAPVSSIKDGKVVEDEGQPRWFDFPINRSTIKTYGIPTK